MLKRIPYDGYDDSEITYADCRESYKSHYNKLYLYDEKRRADKSVKGWIEWDSIEMFDECGMERLIMLIAGMLFCIETAAFPRMTRQTSHTQHGTICRTSAQATMTTCSNPAILQI